jgi:hypothetical protein
MLLAQNGFDGSDISGGEQPATTAFESDVGVGVIMQKIL